MPDRQTLTIINAETATFECTFGRGCDGLCCKNGRPSVTAGERDRINAQLARALPLLRPTARRAVEAGGFVSNRTKLGEPMLRVDDGWCVFFNGGCVLHKLAVDDTGDYTRYKPYQCVVFPLEPADDGSWYVRQHGYRGEKWDLFCLDPMRTTTRAVDALATEIEYVERAEADAAG